MNTYGEWKQVKADIFWAEVAPCDHILQIYESDNIFIDTLAGFVGSGINCGDCCIIIATKTHLDCLAEKLKAFGVHVDTLVQDHRYIPIIAEELLSKFMVNDWPDEELFFQTVSTLLTRCRKTGRRIRAFGEMVALLWAQGHNGATVHLEHLWNRFCEKETFCLFCAYPKAGFTGDIISSVGHICDQHSKVLSGSEKQMVEIYYKDHGEEKHHAVA